MIRRITRPCVLDIQARVAISLAICCAAVAYVG
jgi:hypothetical protein